MVVHYTLHHTVLEPASRLVRLQLQEKNLQATLQAEEPWKRDEALLQRNPSGETPILVNTKKNETIASIYAIIEYLEEAHPKRNLLGQSALEKAETRRLCAWFTHNFNQEVTRNLLHEKFFKRISGDGQPHSDAIRAGKLNILYHLDYIDFLTTSRNWLAGDNLSLADLAAAAHLSALDYFGDVPWEHNKRAKDWYALVKSRPCFKDILAERIPGYRPPEHYDDLDF